MKKYFLVLLLFSYVIPAFAQLQGDTYAAAKQSKKASWTLTYSESPGLATFVNGKPDGVCYDIMEEFAAYVEDETGIEITLNYAKVDDPTNFTAYLADIKKSKGAVFGLSNTSITEERKKSYHFSPPFMKNVSMILTHNSVAEITDLKNITSAWGGFKAVVVKGSVNEMRLSELKKKYLPNLQIEYSPSFQKSIESVVGDKKVFTSVDFTFYLMALRDRKPIKHHAILDEKGEEFGIIMPLSNDWNGLLTEFMTSSGFIESSVFKKMIVKHLGRSVLTFTQEINK
jgi:putative glutamine transport system substrate-binding protein